MEKATFIQCLFNVVMYLCIIGIIIPLYKSSGVNCVAFKRKYIHLMLLAFLVCIFPYWAGDYINMRRDFRLAKQGDLSNWEQVYQWLSLSLPTYTMLRAVVWGGALFLLHKFFKVLSNRDFNFGVCSTLFFFAMCLPNFSYLRAATCMSMIFLGVALVLVRPKEEQSICGYLVALFLIASSFYFHKSAIIAIAVLFISLFSVQFKKFKYILVLLVIIAPYAIRYANTLLSDFVMLSPLEDSSINIYTAQNYFNDQMEVGDTGPGMLVQNILSRTQYYLVLLIYFLILFKGYFKTLPKYIKFFANFAAFTIIIANITQFAFEITAQVLYYRILYYSMIPAAVFLAYCVKNNYYKRLCSVTFYLAIIGTLYTFVYSTYNIL